MIATLAEAAVTLGVSLVSFAIVIAISEAFVIFDIIGYLKFILLITYIVANDIAFLIPYGVALGVVLVSFAIGIAGAVAFLILLEALIELVASGAELGGCGGDGHGGDHQRCDGECVHHFVLV